LLTSSIVTVALPDLPNYSDMLMHCSLLRVRKNILRIIVHIWRKMIDFKYTSHYSGGSDQ